MPNMGALPRKVLRLHGDELRS